MKKFWLVASAALALVVVANIAIRGALPQFRSVEALPALFGHPVLAELLEVLAKPGLYVTWNLGADVNSMSASLTTLVISWWVWLSTLRILWFRVGSACGISSLDSFSNWTRLAPPWRPVFRCWMKVAAWWRQFGYGDKATAIWASPLSQMTRVFKRGDSIFLGKLWVAGFAANQPVELDDPRHVMVVAGSGSGKTSWATAWLLMMDKNASALVVDCDAQMVNAAGATLAREGHKIINLDPYGLSRVERSRWNPIVELDSAAARHGRQAVIRFAVTLAEALVPDSNTHQSVFCEIARLYVYAEILRTWLTETGPRRTLVTVREKVTAADFDAHLDQMIHIGATVDDGCGGAITSAISHGASVMKSCQRGRDGNPFRSTAVNALWWIDIAELAELIEESDFALEDLKTGNPCVFVVGPVTDIQTKMSGLVRALVMMGAYAFECMPGHLPVPSLWLIDEAANLGRIAVLETASAVFRRYGIRLTLILQDLGRWKQVYPQTWESFFGNAAVTLLMGGGHYSTYEYFSKYIGSATREQVIENGGAPARVDRRDVLKINPNQLIEFLNPKRRQVVAIIPGLPPMRLAYVPYHRALPVWRYEPDPNFKETLFRSCTRKLLNWFWLRKSPRTLRHKMQGNGSTR